MKAGPKVDESENDTFAFSCVQPICIFCETVMPSLMLCSIYRYDDVSSQRFDDTSIDTAGPSHTGDCSANNPERLIRLAVMTVIPVLSRNTVTSLAHRGRD